MGVTCPLTQRQTHDASAVGARKQKSIARLTACMLTARGDWHFKVCFMGVYTFRNNVYKLWSVKP
jgi:hypothetical protein